MCNSAQLFGISWTGKKPVNVFDKLLSHTEASRDKAFPLQSATVDGITGKGDWFYTGLEHLFINSLFHRNKTKDLFCFKWEVPYLLVATNQTFLVFYKKGSSSFTTAKPNLKSQSYSSNKPQCRKETLGKVCSFRSVSLIKPRYPTQTVNV